MLRDGSVEVEATWCGVDREPQYDQRCEKLHRTLRRIVKARGALDAQEAAALREAEQLRLWRHYGYSSLLEYMELQLGYSPRAALERLRVAKAIEELPQIADAMTQGDLSFSGARELTRVATPETEQEWLEAAQDKNLREVEELVSGRTRGQRPTDPADPTLKKRVLRYEVNAETVALVRQAKQLLESECGERLDDNQLMRAFARLVIDGAHGPERTKAPYQIAVTVCEACKRGWQDGGGLTVEMSPPAVETALCDAQHIGSLEPAAPQSAEGSSTGGVDDMVPCESGLAEARRGESERGLAGSRAGAKHSATEPERKAARATQANPPALRRKVMRRDHSRCRVPGCRSARNLDQHHIVPRAEGGANTEENVLTLCESHHLAHHGGALIIEGTASNPRFTRRAHNAFAIAERAIETGKALEELGFDKHEVATAVNAARTHVGTAELSLEQWIRIALGYCAKPLR